MRKLVLSSVCLWDFLTEDMTKGYDDGFDAANHLLAQYAALWNFRYVELVFLNDDGSNWKKYKTIKGLLDAAGLVVAAVYGGTWGGTPEEYDKKVEEKKRFIEVCRFFNCDLLTGSGSSRFENGLGQCVHLLEDILPAAEDAEVDLSLEPHMGNQLQYLPDYVFVLDAVKHPRVGMCLDTGHFFGAGVDMQSLLDLYIDRVNHVHLKDASRAGGNFFVPYGHGKIDNEGILARLVKNHYRGFCSLELILSPSFGFTKSGVRPHIEEYLQDARRMYGDFES